MSRPKKQPRTWEEEERLATYREYALYWSIWIFGGYGLTWWLLAYGQPAYLRLLRALH